MVMKGICAVHAGQDEVEANAGTVAVAEADAIGLDCSLGSSALSLWSSFCRWRRDVAEPAEFGRETTGVAGLLVVGV